MRVNLCLTLAVLLIVSAVLQQRAFAQHGSNPLGRNLQFVQFTSKALTGNLIGDSPVREFAVLLPPSYYRNQQTRFPAVYVLHGLGKRIDGHMQNVPMFVEMFDAMRQKKLKEMILVSVDGSTIFGGSYYANSPTIGNFEEYVVQEIVSRVDSLYRTQPSRESRAVASFSMGGYGAIKLGMKHSDIFSQVGSLSGSPLSIRYRKTIYRSALLNHRKPTSVKELVDEITYESNWSLAAAYAKAAAFSPNPKKPPLYLDLPFEKASRDEDDPVWQRWWDDDPLALVARYFKNLRTLSLIYIDHGDDETTLGTEDFIRELVRYGVGYTYSIFRGDHVDNLNLRFLRMFRALALAWTPE